MKRVIFHIGFSKTGTTAIQQFLHLNRDQLKSQGILYPETFDYRGCHHKFYWLLPPFLSNGNKLAIEINNEETFEENYKLLINEFEDSGCETLLISTELFSNHPLKEKLLNLKKYFKDFDVSFVMYIRKQDEFVKSIYNQLVKNNEQTKTFQQFLKQNKPMIDNINYHESIQTIVNLFGKEKVLIGKYIKNSFEGGNIFCDFMSKIGVAYDDDFTLPPKDSNPSFPDGLLNLMRTVNSFDITKKEKIKIRNLIVNIDLPDEVAKRNSENVFVVEHEVYSELVKSWNVSNRWLNSIYLLNATQELFDYEINDNSFPVREQLSLSEEMNTVIEYMPTKMKSILLGHALQTVLNKVK